ncbi:MAG: AtpZ/AtpI family protein [Candidatus Moraniibacteriota bacterium]|nr:MAG: AtpZ/AtpI family protein [Candidatus Moranbacteria bacterium]
MSNIHKVDRDFSLTVETKKRESAKTSQKDTLLIAKYSSIGYYLITPLLLGVFVGLWVDSYFRSQPTFTLVGIVIGFISAAYSLFKLVKET